MSTRLSIQRMHEAIASYDGSFGDPIVELVDFDPLKVLQDLSEDAWVRSGAAIALLVNFCNCTDNSDFESALESIQYRQLKFAQGQKLFADFPPIENAATQAGESEPLFNSALHQVYVEYVIKAVIPRERGA